MKCPNCGREIPEGGLICENCAQEIHIVPVYDTRVEDTISETMSAIKDEMESEAADAAKDQGDKTGKNGKGLTLRGSRKATGITLAALLAVLVIAFAFYYRSTRSPSHYYGLAYDAIEAGDYDKAAELLETGLSMSDEHDHRLMLTLAECLQKSGDTEAAIETAREIIEDRDTDSEDLMNAYGRLLSCYSFLEDYESAASLMDACTDKRVRLAYQEFMTPSVKVDPESGAYEGRVYLTAEGSESAVIYYTLDNSTPDTGSDIYTGPVSLTNGNYKLAFMAVNPYGISSPIIRRNYDIHLEIPGKAEVITPSGTYTEQTMIEAVVPEEGTLYYTTDGSTPTIESKVYTEPVPMPEGTSNFCFAIISDAGAAGEITEVHYNLSVIRSLSHNEGVNCILNVMIQRGQTVDMSGTIAEGNARFTYVYAADSSFEGYGSFYLYYEFLTDVEGNSVQTGRCFAVQVPSGAVFLYDPSAEGAAGLLRL
ncbi:MAG: chitobiase/beta-hexosaminidase C-terminal domain-containing protein [Lachnospiraceae bacterium]|nr:chitobiase/beta-hexosaminidase C-terminal domain-containing protein [Lachnospiraceae bacterium]